MPHLQEKADEKNDTGSRGGPSMSFGSDLPITEAKEGFLQATEGLLTMKTMTSASGPPRAVSEDTAFTPQPHSAKQSVITPSPYGSSTNPGPKFGPIVTIFGNKKLVPSPIRVKRRVSNSEDDDVDAPGTSNTMGQPTNLRYAEDYSTPTRSRLSHTVSEGFETEEPTKKRLLGQLENGEESESAAAKKPKQNSEQTNFSAAINNDAAKESSAKIEVSPESNPVISPASSDEKGDEDDVAPPAPHSGAYPPYAHHGGFNPQAYAPRRHPYPPAPYGQPPYAGYPMYNGYPPPPPHLFAGGHSNAPPFYPPYPSHHPAMMHQFSRPMHPHAFPGSPHRMMPGKPAVPPSEIARHSPPPQDQGINSVADWRRAALTNGKPPSANRCVPLKEPIPSKYWGNAERTKDATLPDFHRLVNFPDYLVKSRNSSNSESSQTPAGKKNCVMCGKLRVCSASSFVGRGRAAVKPDVSISSSSSTEEDECSAHIIPRQNKGLCTACDVTVWVAVAEGLEIKWCKGCKNFRPWAAFGDKGSATKCVRCRDRQREKYAMQKDEVKQRKYKRAAPGQEEANPMPTSIGKDDERTHLAAAHGLRNLMNASAV